MNELNAQSVGVIVGVKVFVGVTVGVDVNVGVAVFVGVGVIEGVMAASLKTASEPSELNTEQDVNMNSISKMRKIRCLFFIKFQINSN